MNKSYRVIGLLLIAFGLISLLYANWFNFLVFSAWGTSLLINPKVSGAAQKLRKALQLAVIILAVIRMVDYFLK